MELENLSLVKGLPRETIEAKLKEAGIDYSIFMNDKNTSNSPFFRASSIYLNEKTVPGRIWEPMPIKWSEFHDALGWSDYFLGNTYFFYAKYNLLPGFDISRLDVS